MNESRYQMHWAGAHAENDEVVNEEVITMESSNDVDVVEEYFVDEEIIPSSEINTLPNTLHQIQAENLVYIAQGEQVGSMGDFIEETVEQVENADYNEQQYFECQVTEEVITDDWVQQQGEERVEIPVDQLCGSGGDSQLVEDIDVPLPTDQDEYTALRPFPCDFCSRRFRKKVSLNNHMIAHQNDRHHSCHLCGVKFLRRNELISHLNMHVQSQDQSFEDIDYSFLNDQIDTKPLRRDDYCDVENDDDEHRSRQRDRSERHKNKHKIKEERYLNSEALHAMVEPRNIRYPATDPRKPFVCQQCGIGFAREKALLSHSRMHDDLNILCDQQKPTNFESSNSEYEPEHDEDTESENDSKYGEFFCDVCGLAFHRQDLLKRHSKLHVKREFPDPEPQHCCNVCGQTFAEPLELLAHAEIHARIQPFKCVLCGETYLEQATIRKHVMNIHSSELNEFSCLLCGKQCRDARTLAKHSFEHSKEKDHCCMKCGKTFHNKARLKRHMASHRNKSVTCNVCNGQFPDGRSLMNHRHSHTNTTGKLFPCNECGKTFGSRSSQQIHVRIHTGERPYGCKYCWKAFADGGTLRKHERIHTGEKPYACSVCPKAFNQRVVLREHIRTHHSAPDAKRGTDATPYYCTVCSDMFVTSAELIQHLIQHSDMNTARLRQPITTPRKYKRRRKLKPHELERLRTEKSPSDVDYSDLDMGNVDDILAIGNSNKTKRHKHDSTGSVGSILPSRNRKNSAGSDKMNSWQHKLMSSTTNDNSLNAYFQSLEDALQNIEPLVVNNNNNNSNNNNNNSSNNHINNSSSSSKNIATTSTNNLNGSNSTTAATTTTTNTATSQSQSSSAPVAKTKGKRRSNKHDLVEKPSRPKMIHTQKTRVTVDDGKRKTKTLITRTERADVHKNHKNHQTDQIRSSHHNQRKQRNSSGTDYDIIVGDALAEYNSNAVIVKSEPINKSDLFDAQLLLEAASAQKDFDRYTTDPGHDMSDILITPDNPSRDELSAVMNTCKNEKDSPVSLRTVLDSPEEVRRSSRIKRSAKNKKYLHYDTKVQTFQRHYHSKTTDNKIDVLNSIKQEHPEVSIQDDDNIKIEPEDDIVTPKSSPVEEKPRFRCEMCFAVFPDRSQLLVHVPIHI